MPLGTSPTLSRVRRHRSALRWAVPIGLLVAVAVAAVAPAAAYADGIDPAGLPPAPAAVTVEPEPGALVVSWTPPLVNDSAVLTGYDVTVVPADPADGTAPVTAETDAATTTVTLSGLANGVEYTVGVTATDAAGAGPAASAVGTPRTVPMAVALTGASAANNSATVTWQPPASDGGSAVQSYIVTARPSGRSLTVAADATTASIGGLVDGSPTTLSVSAVNAAGAGPAAITAAVTPRLPARLAIAVGPRGLVTYGATTHLTVSLTDTAGHALGGRRVALLYRVGTGAFHTAATGTTGSTGRAALTATLPATSALVVTHAADAVVGLRTSAGTVRVARNMTESAPRAIRIGQYVVTTGAVSPGRTVGAPVQLDRLVGTHWTAVATGKMTTRTSYRVAWKPATSGAVSLRVVIPGNASYAASWGRVWRQAVTAETVATIAAGILRSTRVALASSHESGIADNATAKADLQALAAGHWAPRSSYQNAPGGSTAVDIRLLRALRALGGKARVTVSEVAGGSHAVGSSHYRGEAMDVTVVNGVSIAAGGNYSLVASVCRSYGATAVYDPGYDPYGGHSNHVHCQWGVVGRD